MGQTKTPRGKRKHTPVWEVLWSVRPQLKGFLVDLPVAVAAPAPQGKAAVRTAPAAAAAPVRPASAPTRTAPPKAQDSERPPVWWVKQVGKDVALVPLKLLHLLLAGYEPQARRPQIRYRQAT